MAKKFTSNYSPNVDYSYVFSLHDSGIIHDVRYIPLIFGAVTCFAGLAAIILVGFLDRKLRPFHSNADPLIAAWGLLFSAPMLFLILVLVEYHITAVWPLIFLAEVSLFMNWVLVPKIILDCTVPNRRAFAAGKYRYIRIMKALRGYPKKIKNEFAYRKFSRQIGPVFQVLFCQF